MRTLRTYILALLALGILVQATPPPLEKAKGPDPSTATCYLVKSASGRVLRWSITRAAWFEVKSGYCVPQGTVVQLDFGASVSLLARPALLGEQDVGGKLMMIELSSPLIIRMAVESFRKMTISRQFIEQKDLTKGTSSTTDDSLEAGIRNAWNQMSALLIKQNMLAQTALNKEVKIASMAKPIKVLYPSGNALIFRDEFPAKIMITWRPLIDYKGRYQVYLWKKEQLKMEPLASVGGEYFSLAVQEPGSYYIQVTTPDLSYQSIPHFFHVVSRLELFVGDKKNAQKNIQLLESAAPPNNFVMVTQKRATKINFLWNFRLPEDSDRGRPAFKIFIEESEKPLKPRVQTLRTPYAESLLPTGEYQWWVEATYRSREGTEQKYISARRNLKVIDSTIQNPDQMIDALLAKPRLPSQYIYLDNAPPAKL